jgi:hypothetical protein
MRIPRLALAFLVFVWVLVVLYPDPGVLVRSIHNALRPRVDPAAASALAARLPDDPRLIEAYVLEQQVPWVADWQSAGVPWYSPTGAEALAAGPGDCESRAMVLASLLAAKGIPYDLRMSFGHIWVEYPSKAETRIENAGLEIAGRRDGRFFLQLPRDLDVRQEIADQISIHWTPAPPERVLLLFVGVLLIPWANAIAGLLSGNGVAGARGAGLAGRFERPDTVAPKGRRHARKLAAAPPSARGRVT